MGFTLSILNGDLDLMLGGGDPAAAGEVHHRFLASVVVDDLGLSNRLDVRLADDQPSNGCLWVAEIVDFFHSIIEVQR